MSTHVVGERRRRTGTWWWPSEGMPTLLFGAVRQEDKPDSAYGLEKARL